MNKKFQIVIPMSGLGMRFQRAGYKTHKTLIEVEGKPIIAHILDMFPGEKDVLFICNEKHLANPEFKMEKILKKFCPTGKIIGIKSRKLGPVYALLEADKYIDKTRPVIVNYADFTCYWNYNDFKSFLKKTGCDGCIPAYKGFHPHSLGPNYYAYMKEKDGWVKDIQEKKPYTKNKMEEFASSGTYYFKSGQLLLDACKKQVEQKLKTGSEYYVSLTYKPLLKARKKIAVYELQHFMQWGTPEDLREYNYWSGIFRKLAKNKTKPPHQEGVLLIPMAGLGKRFSDAGYSLPKPLIPVSGKPMVQQAINMLPRAECQRLIVRNDAGGLGTLRKQLGKSEFIAIDELTDGQARTCLIGVEGLDQNKPVTIASCDNGALFDSRKFSSLMHNKSVDVIVWGVRGHPDAARNPKAFGWIDADKNGKIKKVLVKTPLKDPGNDPIIIGTFTFKRVSDFVECSERMIRRRARINGEYYVDMAINDAIALGLNCVLFEVEAYLGWGTPNDLETFEYWQSCFHKWPSHPYTLFKDRLMARSSLSALDKRYRTFKPKRPK